MTYILRRDADTMPPVSGDCSAYKLRMLESDERWLDAVVRGDIPEEPAKARPNVVANYRSF